MFVTIGFELLGDEYLLTGAEGLLEVDGFELFGDEYFGTLFVTAGFELGDEYLLTGGEEGRLGVDGFELFGDEYLLAGGDEDRLDGGLLLPLERLELPLDRLELEPLGLLLPLERLEPLGLLLPLERLDEDLDCAGRSINVLARNNPATTITTFHDFINFSLNAID